MKFSDKIIQARKAKALTQEDLAEAVGVSRQAVSKWETDEAKPDLDKLVAICKTLDLSMDYLCLDKEPEVAVELPPTQPKSNGIRYLLIGVCIGFVVAILIGFAAMALKGNPNDSTEPSTTVAPTDYSGLIGLMKIEDASFISVPDDGGHDKRRITFVPSMDVPGMQVQILVRNNIAATEKYYDVNGADGAYYLEQYVAKSCNFDFIAVFTLDDVSVQVPLYKLVQKDGAYMLYTLWEKS